MWQAEKVLEKYRNSNGATPDPEILKKQEELKESFEKASAPFRKIEEYKDKNALSLLFDNVEEPINTLKEALEAIKKSKLVLDLPVGVSREERGAYVIDLSIVDPADLAKLNLAKLDEITFYGSDKENSKCSNNIPPLIINVDMLLHSFYQDTLKAGYGLLETNKYSQDDTARYKEVLNFYATFRFYCTLKKTDLKPNDFHNWLWEGYRKALSLRRRHVEMLSTVVSQSLDPSEQSNLRETQGTNLSDDICRKISYADNIIADTAYELSIYVKEMLSEVGLWFGDGHNLRAQREILQEEQYDNSTSMSHFSDNSIERVLANEMVVSHAYHDLWAKHGLQQPDTDKFWTDYVRVQSIVETRIEDIKPEEREGFLYTMREINQSLKKTAEALARAMPKGNKDSVKDNIKEEDLNPLQLSLRDAIQETRRFKQWREAEWPNIAKRFDLNDDWVDIKVKKEHIEESCIKHRENVHVRQIINDDRDTIQVTYNCSPSKVVETYEKLIRANASLKYICDQFDHGVPAKFEPKHIKGRDVLAIPFHNNNCLIHSLIKVSNPEKQWREIKRMATTIRDTLVDANLADYEEFLDLHSVGRRVIDELIAKEWLEPSRGLVVYQAAIVGPENHARLAEINEEWIPEAGKIVVYSHEEFPRTEENPAKPEYALFVKGLYHFQPMLEPM